MGSHKYWYLPHGVIMVHNFCTLQKILYYTLWNSKFWMSYNGSCSGGPVAIVPQKNMMYGTLNIIIYVRNFLK